MKVRIRFGGGLGCAVVVGMLIGPAMGGEPVVAGSGPVATGVATGASSKAVATNAQDFSQGFRAFIRLGLPDVSKAKYVRLSGYGLGDEMNMSRLYEVQLAGGAWLVSEDKEAKSILITPSGRRMELYDQKTYMKRQEAMARSNALAQAASAQGGATQAVQVSVHLAGPGLAEQCGTWSEADLARDLAKATAFVDKKLKAKAASAREARYEYDSFTQTEGAMGGLFLLATFAWQNGKVAEANALAGSLFSLAGDSRRVIVDAMNVVANDQLAAAGEAFGRSADWKAYHAAVDGLLTKYPSGWRQAGAAKLLADRLQARAAMTTPPPVTGEGVTDEDRKLADALATDTNAVARMRGNWWMGQLWILPQPAAARRMASYGMKDTSVLGRITERGVKSIPLLMALASDETLCPLRRNEAGLGTVYHSYSGRGGGDMSAEQDLELYNQTLDRPATRGEIARSLLASICPRDERDNRGEAPDAAELVEAAGKLYATLKSIPPDALPKHFLEKGDMNQKQAALGFMLQGDVETNAAVIEAFLLTPPSGDDENPWMGYGSGYVQQYVQKRGEKAAAFVEKYAAMRKGAKLPEGMGDDPNMAKQMEKQLERELKMLQAMVKKQDLAETVSDLAKADAKGGSAMAAYSTIARQKPEVALPILLDATVKATNLQMRVQLLQMMSMLRYSGMQEAMQEEAAGGDMSDPQAVMKAMAGKNQLGIGTNAAAWKILLADTRPMPNSGMYGSAMAGWTMGDMVASSIESLYGDVSKMQEEWMSGSAFPDMMRKVMRARAEARVAGKTEEQLPRIPSPEDVTPERRKAIEADLVKLDLAGLTVFLDKLTDAERMYLAGAAAENEAIQKRLAPVMRRIAEVKVDAGLPAESAGRLRKLEGTTLTTNALTVLREVCERQVGSGKAVMLTLSSGGLGRGLQLNLMAPDAAMMRMYGGYSHMSTGRGTARKGMVVGTVQNGEHSASGTWMVDLPASSNAVSTGTVVAASAESDEDEEDSDQIDSGNDYMDSMREQFETAAVTFCKPDEPVAAMAMVMFVGIVPPEKRASKDGDDEDGDEDEDMGFGIPMDW